MAKSSKLTRNKRTETQKRRIIEQKNRTIENRSRRLFKIARMRPNDRQALEALRRRGLIQ